MQHNSPAVSLIALRAVEETIESFREASALHARNQARRGRHDPSTLSFVICPSSLVMDPTQLPTQADEVNIGLCSLLQRRPQNKKNDRATFVFT